MDSKNYRLEHGGARHDQHLVYMRSDSLDRLFGGDDGDTVANWYDECTETPPGAAVC